MAPEPPSKAPARPASGPRPPLVLVTEELDDEAVTWLSERCRVVQASAGEPGFSDALGQAEGLVVRTYTTVDEAMLSAAPRLRVVGRAGVGLDNIDLAACGRRGVRVVHTPDANTQAVAEYVLCLACDALRPRQPLDRAIDLSEWRRQRTHALARRELCECTLGILGLGRIGRRVARAAHGIGMPAVYHDLVEIPVEERSGAVPVAVDELFARADVLSVHVDGRAGNRRLVDARLLDLMKPDVVFINTSRGLVVDDGALASFLRAHPAALAMLDVHDPEPFPEGHPLLGLPNARLYPHLASRTVAAQRRMSDVVHDVVAVLEGGEPRHEADEETAARHALGGG